MKYLFAVITTLLLASHANADDSARVKQLEATIRELTIQNAKLIRQNQNLKLDKGADTEQLPEAGKAAEQERVALEKVLKDKLRQENLARLAGLSDTGAAKKPRWKKPTAIPWSSLAMQFGSNYSRLTDFRVAFLGELKKVVTVYGGVQVEASPTGLLVKPSLTHIGKKGGT